MIEKNCETLCTEKPPNVNKKWEMAHMKSVVEFDTTHLHGVRHAVVIIAVTDLGEKVLTQLEKQQI